MPLLILTFVLLAGCTINDPPPEQPAPSFELIQLTGLDHEVIRINPNLVVGLREPGKQQLVTRHARCAVVTTDGHFFSVLETCTVVERRLEHKK